MRRFESIVPSFELCKFIPAGEFDDSWLVWRDDNINHYVHLKFNDPEYISHKDESEEVNYFPAPTAGEVMSKLVTPSLWRSVTGRWHCMCKEHVMVMGGKTASEAALRMWLRVKGIEVK